MGVFGLDCGSWVHIRDDLEHRFAGYDGEIVRFNTDSVVVRVYDIAYGDDRQTLHLFPCYVIFRGDELLLLGPVNQETTLDIFKKTILKWNKRIKAD